MGSVNDLRRRNSEIGLGFITFIGFTDQNYLGTSTAKRKRVVQNLLHLDSLFTGENHITVVAPQRKASIDDGLPGHDCKKNMKKVLYTIRVELQRL